MKQPEGLRFFDLTQAGILRSFGAFVWTWPVQCFLWTGLWRAMPQTKPDTIMETLRFFAVSSSFDIASWAVPALLLIVATQLFGLSARRPHLLVVNNWFGLMSAYIGFIPATLRYLLPVPDTINIILSLGIYAIVIWLYFRVIRACVEGDVMMSVFITLMMIMTGLTISELAYNALGAP